MITGHATPKRRYATPECGKPALVSPARGHTTRPDMDIRTALQRYLRHHRTSGASPHTISAHARWAGQFAAYLDRQHHSGQIEELAADDLRGWLDELRSVGVPGPYAKPNSDRSLRSKAIHVKAFVHWLVAEDYLQVDPFRRVATPKADDAPKTTLTPVEVSAILQRCNPRTLAGRRDAAMILLLYSTALRSAELRAIRVADVDHDQGQIVIRRGKGGKFRIVPLSPKVERAIDRYLNHPQRQRQGTDGVLFLTRDGNTMPHVALRNALQRAGDRAGVHANPHKWRHSSSVQYLRTGGKLEVLQKLLGHTTLQMSLHYARLAGVDVKAAHETADPTNGIAYRP